MPRATTKIELIRMSNEQFDKLFKIIDDMSDKDQNAGFCFDIEKMDDKAHWKRDKNLRDVLVHLHEWHKLLLEWESANINGKNRPFLPPPYTWKTYGEMNMEFWQMHQNTQLTNAKQMLKESHGQIITLIERYTDEQLFLKSFFKWTGTTSLGQYCISATSSHYDWAIKKLKEQIKSLKIR